MKKLVNIVVILILIIAFTGCQSNSISQEDYEKLEEENEALKSKVEQYEQDGNNKPEQNNKEDSNKEDSEADEDNQLEDEEAENSGQDSKTTVTITSYYEEPAFIHDDNVILLEGTMEGEFLVIEINGEVNDFKHVGVKWDEEKADLVETEVLNEFKELKDIKIIINTYMPEGIPSEKVTWKSKKGDTYEFIIQANGKGETSWNFNLE